MRRAVASTITVVLLLATTVGPGARAESDQHPSQGGPVAVAPIQPGAAVCAVEDIVSELSGLPSCDMQGTLNFVFRDDHGGLYVGTAAHVVPSGNVDVFVPSCATCRGLPTQPFGRVVFQSDSVDVGHPADLAEPDLLDFALIKIRPAWHHLVEPRVRYWGGPLGVIEAPEAATTDAAVAYGNGEGESPGPRGPGQVIAASRTSFSTTVTEVGGDSGMPFLHGPSGKALGINGNCPCGGGGYYPTVEHVLDRLAAHGFRLSLVTGAAAPPLAALLSSSANAR